MNILGAGVRENQDARVARCCAPAPFIFIATTDRIRALGGKALMIISGTRIVAGLCLLYGCALARADTSLSVDIAWGGHMRPHRWVPVLVTASDSKNRNVLLEVYWPHGGSYAMSVRQVFTIGPIPSTFPLVLPIHNYFGIQQASFTLRDADSGKTLARFPEQPGMWTGTANYMTQDSAIVGVSGRQTNLELLQGNLNAQELAIDFLAPGLLPTTALGYDSLDLLVLNQPNLSTTPAAGTERAIDATQQQAILDWVRAGGNLVLWPSALVPFPASGPIVDVLPAHVGARETFVLEAPEAKQMGLNDGQRAVTFNQYRLTPEAGARQIDLFGGKTAAYEKALGLGRIVLVPIDLSVVSINPRSEGQEFWRPLLAGMHVLPERRAARTQPQQLYGPQITRDDQRETAATMAVADKLGDVPGAGRFGFSYVVIVLVGMMFVVGPVDWIVLKKLGRQPWTWITTSGWILLITLSAISLGYVLKSGDLHYRTLRLIEQVGDSAVAATDYVAIYSPRTRTYALATDADSWWQPAGVEDYSRSDMTIDLRFHQTYEGNTPEPMSIGVWSLRFLRGDRVGSSPAVMVASLHRESNPDRIVGVIKNLSDRPLKDLHVRVDNLIGDLVLHPQTPTTTASTTAPAGDSTATVQVIAPFATVRVEAALKEDPSVKAEAEQQQPPQYYRYNQYAVQTEPLWKSVGHLDMRRSDRIERLISDDNHACVYGEFDSPPAPVKLIDQTPIEQHFQFVRAVVELKGVK